MSQTKMFKADRDPKVHSAGAHSDEPADRADFLAGAHLDNGDPQILLNSISRYYKFLPGEQQQAFLENLGQKVS